jgi:hypothetical protein
VKTLAGAMCCHRLEIHQPASASDQRSPVAVRAELAVDRNFERAARLSSDQ